MDLEDRKFARQMGDYWVQFARSGNPNCKRCPTGPAFTLENPVQMQFGQQIPNRSIDRAACYEPARPSRLRQIDLLAKLCQ